ncbi:MAG: hypothetical protein ACFFBW_15030 [Promethearchaeota archaeon]
MSRNNDEIIRKYLPSDVATKSGFKSFDENKIYRSLLKETTLNYEAAEQITKTVLRRIISSEIGFLSGPHIREIVCSVLSEMGYEEERKQYTRIGRPMADLKKICEEYLKKIIELSKMNLPKQAFLRRRRKIRKEFLYCISSWDLREFTDVVKISKNFSFKLD